MIRCDSAIGSGISSGVSLAGVAEHQALVAGADVLALLAVLVHALGDVGRLLAEGDHDGAGLGVEAHLARRVADLLDDLADDRSGSRSSALVVISPATTTRPVVSSVSQATREYGVLLEDRVENRRRRSGRPSCRDGPSTPIRW